MESSTQALPVQSMEILTTEQLRQAWSRGEKVEFGDPALERTALSLTGTFFPLGFPLTLSTNCQEVLDAAAESWGHFEKLFDINPIRLDVGVAEGGSSHCPPPPLGKLRGHLLVNISDTENFVSTDLSQGYSLIWVTRSAIEHRTYFRYFFLEATAMACIVQRHAVGIHAGCVELDGAGVLLCGDSGAGKSTLSYACARAGWTYVTDDASFLVHGREDRLVVGNCSLARFRPQSEAFFPELSKKRIVQRADTSKPSIELSISAHTVQSSSHAKIRHLVFLNRSGNQQDLIPFPPEVARLYIMQRVPVQAANAEETVDNLLETGALELRYSDLNWAVDRLTDLIRNGG